MLEWIPPIKASLGLLPGGNNFSNKDVRAPVLYSGKKTFLYFYFRASLHSI